MNSESAHITITDLISKDEATATIENEGTKLTNKIRESSGIGQLSYWNN